MAVLFSFCIFQVFFEQNGRRIDPIFMATRFVPLEHDTRLLLPANLRDWVPAGHLVHFILDAVGGLDLRQVRVNTRSPRINTTSPTPKAGS